MCVARINPEEFCLADIARELGVPREDVREAVENLLAAEEMIRESRPTNADLQFEVNKLPDRF